MRTGEYADALERRTEAAAPGDVGLVAELQEQFELLDEQRVIGPCIKSEERKSLCERAAAGDDFSPPAGYQVEGREFLEDPHRIRGAQYGHRARQADGLCPGCCGGEDDRRRGFEKFGPVVFADPENVEPDAVGQFDFPEQVRHAIRRRRNPVRCGIGENGRKTVDTDFHHRSFTLIR